MDDLSTLATKVGRSARILRALIADDANSVNDSVFARAPGYDAARPFGPLRFSPRPRADSSGVLLPSRNDPCVIALDENGQAELLEWWVEDPTEDAPQPPRWAEYGPYSADAGTLSAGASDIDTVPHDIPGFNPYSDPPPEFIVTGHLSNGPEFEGTNSEFCSWRVDTVYESSVAICLGNPSAVECRPILTFTIKVKVL